MSSYFDDNCKFHSLEMIKFKSHSVGYVFARRTHFCRICFHLLEMAAVCEWPFRQKIPAFFVCVRGAQMPPNTLMTQIIVARPTVDIQMHSQRSAYDFSWPNAHLRLLFAGSTLGLGTTSVTLTITELKTRYRTTLRRGRSINRIASICFSF